MGISKQSQKRTKRAAFLEASESEHARQHHRLVRHDADGRPSMRQSRPDFLANWSWISRSRPSTTLRISSLMS